VEPEEHRGLGDAEYRLGGLPVRSIAPGRDRPIWLTDLLVAAKTTKPRPWNLSGLTLAALRAGQSGSPVRHPESLRTSCTNGIAEPDSPLRPPSIAGYGGAIKWPLSPEGLQNVLQAGFLRGHATTASVPPERLRFKLVERLSSSVRRQPRRPRAALPSAQADAHTRPDSCSSARHPFPNLAAQSWNRPLARRNGRPQETTAL